MDRLPDVPVMLVVSGDVAKGGLIGDGIANGAPVGLGGPIVCEPLLHHTPFIHAYHNPLKVLTQTKPP